ncbi:hypothetical protein [Mucilaginibacter celer]|uniref:Uncharacterized protein n=1 Tax=Mucilaginibacter celer TaxID=2305508 RepID=A0A494VXB6_9SPHI|nr:hypothetical protein [Mucilaginibacter celer]AYL99039.1 hypothetical protein HYN43_028865 [Mucilaginibacter celer]
METAAFILDTPLPLSQNFKLLKQDALAYIQLHSGSRWTNYNTSDPGVTILDQVCFALTELGYCNDFPISDILTNANGKINYKDQFYQPEQILTTSPVTIADYRKYIIDGVANINNVVMAPYQNTGGVSNNTYQIYLAIDEQVTGEEEQNEICMAAFFYLNKRRNLGEMFMIPQPLQVKQVSINGTIEIAAGSELNTVLAAINRQIRDYIFPDVSQQGYSGLTQTGIDVNEVFNGPVLHNGYISDEALGEKKDRLTLMELIDVLSGVPGVVSLNGINFNPAQPGNIIIAAPNELIIIDLALSLFSGLSVLCRGKELPINKNIGVFISRSQDLDTGVVFGAPANIQPALPVGNYREIDSYYSIQNTFPEIFAVGPDAITSNASDFQIAQSRQLKGYLTLFDQVLANQFSQLANIDKLFSFKNQRTGTPATRNAFYAVKTPDEKKHSGYPVPYLSFAPTYFYRALYDVPNIRPLLKDNDTFGYGTVIETDKEKEQQSWIAYTQDPYNPYIWGLMGMLEDEQQNITRRNDILNHLLARHGESPDLIDAVANGIIYSGSRLKDQVIIKSLYLQNLGLLSYYRQKAYNYVGAGKLDDLPLDVPKCFGKGIFEDTNDFIFNSRELDKAEKLTEKDFINFSAIELKIGLFFGIQKLYREFISDNYDVGPGGEIIQQAFWMMSQCRGVIAIETRLLLQFVDFEIVLTQSVANGPYYKTNGHLNYEDVILVKDAFAAGTKCQIDNQSFTVLGQTFALAAADNANGGDKYFTRIDSAPNWLFTIKIIGSDRETEIPDGSPLFDNNLELIYPDFIPGLNNDDFRDRLDLLMQAELPIQSGYNCHFVTQAQLGVLIPVFSLWHNRLIRYNFNNGYNQWLAKSAGNLAIMLTLIYQS